MALKSLVNLNNLNKCNLQNGGSTLGYIHKKWWAQGGASIPQET